MTARRVLVAAQSLLLVGGVTLVITVAATPGAAAADATSGYAMGFGNDVDGQLGSGTVNGNGVVSPTVAKLPTGVTAVQVAAGYSHTVALGSDGVVYAWGANAHGELGNGTTTARSLPAAVSLPSGVTVAAVAAGYLDSFAVTTAGDVYAWGYGGQGELGDGSTVDAHLPVLVHLPAGADATAVSAGYAHTLAVTSTGDMYAWGANSGGQLGDGTTTMRTAPVPVTLPGGRIAAAVAAGYAHSLALTPTGRVYAWGSNNRGQLGTGTQIASAVPVAVDLGDATATSVAAGYLHSVATLADGSARAWGDNGYGQLGAGESSSQLPMSAAPVPVVLDGASATQAAAGFAHTLLLTDDGAILATGDNTYGELGTGGRAGSTAPVPTVLPPGTGGLSVTTSAFSLTSFITVAGADTTTTVTSSAASAPVGAPVTFTATISPNDGTGSVSFTAGETATPLAGCSDLPLHEVSAGTFRATCSTASLPVGTTAVNATYSGGAPYGGSAGSLTGGQDVHAARGEVLAWGGNSVGQLGDGSTTNRTMPVRASVPDDDAVVQVAGGLGHALALLADGSVYAWGTNTYGELGNGTTAPSKQPVPVVLPDGVVPVSVAAGAFTSAVVAADGSLYTWGVNNAGQLGDGTTTNRSVPTKALLPPGTVVTAASLGGAHLLALTSTGAVYAAGGNTAGQLGDNSTAPASTPVPVHLPAGAAATGVAAGYAHSLAVTVDGTVLAWGDNTNGELGNGSTDPAVVPVLAALPAGATAAAVSASYYDSFAVTSDGGVLAWGSNGAGELGTGTTTDAHIPTAVSLPTGARVTAVSGGRTSTYALTDAGAVLAWGDNGSGSLGDGTTTARLKPVAVHTPAGGSVAAIGAGSAAGYAVMPRFASQTAISSSVNPSTAGKPVTFTATVTRTDGGGTVSFTSDGTTIGGCGSVALTATVPYTAKCTTSRLPGGGHDIAAGYSGDLLYAPSSAALSGGQTVAFLVTTTKISTSAAKISYAKSVTFTAKVSGSDGGGTVAFTSDGATIGGCAAKTLTVALGVYQATCKTTALLPGHHTIIASYSGDDFAAPSSATLSGGELVTAATKLAASPVKITEAQGLPTYRAALTVTADGTPLAGMTITFKLNALYGSSSCTAVTDSSGVASCQGARPRISGGQYTAKFAGTDVYLASSGSSTVSF